MIPRDYKRLAEMDFSIGEVSRHAAWEKSIRHGHLPRYHSRGGSRQRGSTLRLRPLLHGQVSLSSSRALLCGRPTTARYKKRVASNESERIGSFYFLRLPCRCLSGPGEGSGTLGVGLR